MAVKRKNRKKTAVSMAEILIALAIIGVIAAITYPSLKGVLTSKEEKLHQKMTYLVEQVVAQLYDDDNMYPKKSDVFKQGFQNTEKVTINGIDYEGDTKFCQLFASKFNKKGNTTVTCQTNSGTNAKSFTSTDNVEWYLPVTNFDSGSAQLIVDVNGPNGANCLEGSANCSHPDRFEYWIKTNGTVTFKEPSNIVNNKFKIILDVTNPAGQDKLEISQLNSNGSLGSFKDFAANHTDLEKNTRYVLRATPKSGWYTEWQLNQRRVTLLNNDVRVKLVYKPRGQYCVSLNVKNCDKDNMTDCATYKLKTGCRYNDKGDRRGNYKQNGDGSYEFVGLGVEGGRYDYECNDDSHTLTMVQGRPIRNADGSITTASGGNSVYLCNLITGDYQIVATPKSGYYVSGDFSTGNTYKQDVKLGTNDIGFEVTLCQTYQGCRAPEEPEDYETPDPTDLPNPTGATSPTNPTNPTSPTGATNPTNPANPTTPTTPTPPNQSCYRSCMSNMNDSSACTARCTYSQPTSPDVDSSCFNSCMSTGHYNSSYCTQQCYTEPQMSYAECMSQLQSCAGNTTCVQHYQSQGCSRYNITCALVPDCYDSCVEQTNSSTTCRNRCWRCN